MKVVTAEEMRALDARAIQEYGVPGVVLMENAGRQVEQAIVARYPDICRMKVGVVAGKGNNGGDGFVVARHLAQRGVKVAVMLLGAKLAPSGDARINLDIIDRMGIPIVEVETEDAFAKVAPEFARCDLLVDAILGTGFVSQVRGLYEMVITAMNGWGKPIVAVDIPSGLTSDTGVVHGAHIVADLTVTFALPKPAHLLFPAAKAVGELVVADIGIPRALLEDESLKVNLLERPEVARWFKPREPDAHKGSFGHLLVLAGSVGKSGAAIMAAKGALRVGAGLVTVGVPASINAAVEASSMEAMSIPLPETGPGTIALKAAEMLPMLLERKDAVVVGPGITTHAETAQFVHELLERVRVPTVIDADGLNNIAGHLHLVERKTVPFLITPHPGEMCRLIGEAIEAIQADRLGVARAVADKYGVYVALKGARTVVGYPTGEAFINPTGNAGLASGGTGDVLAGTIGGLLAQGMAPGQALAAAVFLHGMAADEVASVQGEQGMIAGDLLDVLPRCIKALVEESGGA